MSEFVSKVIFAEAAGTSFFEMYLVASVMNNRVNHPGFGRLPDMRAVASQPGAFSCVGDMDNINWSDFEDQRRLVPEKWRYSQELAEARWNFYPNVVYYHDHSISKPASWDNRWWRAVPAIKTENFQFYNIRRT